MPAKTRVGGKKKLELGGQWKGFMMGSAYPVRAGCREGPGPSFYR